MEAGTEDAALEFGGEPGMRTACLFWPGRSKDCGYRPTYYLKFDDKIDPERGLSRWCVAEAAGGGSADFITLYYSEPDTRDMSLGGCQGDEAAVQKVDQLVGS